MSIQPMRVVEQRGRTKVSGVRRILIVSCPCKAFPLLVLLGNCWTRSGYQNSMTSSTFCFGIFTTSPLTTPNIFFAVSFPG